MGVSLLCTCVAFSPFFAKLNRFFRKRKKTRRITSKDLIDISPDIHQLDTIVSNLVEEHCKQIHEGIWILTHKHQQQWCADLIALGPRNTSSPLNATATLIPTQLAPKPKPRAENSILEVAWRPDGMEFESDKV